MTVQTEAITALGIAFFISKITKEWITMGSLTIVDKSFRIGLEEGLYIEGQVKTLETGTAKPVLLIAHGFRGTKDWGFWPEVSDRFAERGFYTVIFNFSRLSVPEEEVEARAQHSTLSRELSDLKLLLEHVQGASLPFASESDTARIGVLGHSRAGSSAIILAAEQPSIKAAAAWNGGVNPNPPAGDPPAAILLDLDDNRERFNTPRLLANLETPALIVQGTADSERLLEGNRRLRANAPEQTFVQIEGADHVFGALHPFQGTTIHLEEALEVTLTFFHKHL
jgi:uncharacterized protein